MSLFDKKSKVLAGKDSEQKPSQKKSLFASLRAKWNKLNSMEQRQAYTYGAIGLAVLILLFVFGAVMSSSAGKEDFSDFETRGYDLAAMPFSTDEAEQYLLAAKYPDMQGQITDGLYSPEEKEERQQEDAEQALEDFEVGADAASQAAAVYIGGGRSYGG
ncbi:MAG: hypothetical protein J6U96_03200, partial [Elusimicrobiaceae bacterium]|nr:hypothetical protein [Elusimicrobiaceae bacterium]